jgi:PAS domain S-box-containing protein
VSAAWQVLLVEDSADDAELVIRALRAAGLSFEHERVQTVAELERELGAKEWSIILTDHSLPGFSSFDVLQALAERKLDTPCIIVSGHIGEEAAVEAMRQGAADYVNKDNLAHLPPVVSREVGDAAHRQARRDAESRLILLMSAIEAADEAIVITDSQLDPPGPRIAYVTPGFEKVTGYAAAEVIGKTPRILQGPRSDRKVLARLKQTLGRGERFRGETINYRKDGSEYSVEWHITPVRNEHGEVTHFVSVQRDVTDRQLAEDLIAQHVQRLGALRAIDHSITASLDLRATLSVVLDQVLIHLNVDAADLLLWNPHSQTLEFSAGKGFVTSALRHTRLRMGAGLAGRAALQRRMVRIPDLALAPEAFVESPALAGEGFVGFYAVPLLAKGQVRGVLEIFLRSPFDADQDWLDFLEALATQAAIAIDNAALFDDLQRSNVELAMAYDATIEGWSRALDLRDKETEGHTQRVTQLTLRLARDLRVAESELSHMRRGALLHDIGKMGIPDRILLKPGKLDEEEWRIMRLHPIYAYELLSPIGFLKPALDIPYCHHEKFDGTGYPRGLAGAQIPVAARIFAVIDVYDALTSDRPYRQAWPAMKAREYVLAETGKHFDPEVVEAFARWSE